MAVLKINGVEVKAPASLSVGYQEISNAERNALGEMIKERIAVKTKLELNWNSMSNAELQKLLNLVDNNFFTATYYDPQANTDITKVFYAGDKTVQAMYYKNGEMHWKSVAFNIIEK